MKIIAHKKPLKAKAWRGIIISQIMRRFRSDQVTIVLTNSMTGLVTSAIKTV